MYFLRNGVSFSSKSENKTIELKGVERKRLVCLANFRPQKDHKNLLEAFSLVVQKHPGYSLHLFGQNWNDDYFEEINQLMNGAILKEAVYYYGSHANVYEILKQYNKLGEFNFDMLKSAVAASENFVSDFPGSIYREEALLVKADALTYMAVNSFEQVQKKRLESAKTSIMAFKKQYPNSRFEKEITNMMDQIENGLQQYTTESK